MLFFVLCAALIEKDKKNVVGLCFERRRAAEQAEVDAGEEGFPSRREAR